MVCNMFATLGLVRSCYFKQGGESSRDMYAKFLVRLGELYQSDRIKGV